MSTYTFTFTDANGCSSILIASGLNQQNISADVATVAEIDTSSIANILCNGLATGSLEVLNPTVGSGYNYSWQDINGNVIFPPLKSSPIFLPICSSDSAV